MIGQEVDDQQLVRSYLEGNEAAFSQLLTKNRNKVFGYIMKMVRDEDLANDVFQDTFVKVIKTLKSGKYNEEGKFLPWVMRIAHNLVIDYFRKNNRMPSFKNTDEFDIFSVLHDGTLNAEKQIIQAQIYEDVRELINELPEEQKEVLIMRMYKDMSFKEISENTGVSINTALGRMRYALINMRKLIEKHKIILVN